MKLRYRQFYVILFTIAAFLLLASLLWERKGIEEVIAEHELDMAEYTNYDKLYALAESEEQKTELNFLKANDIYGSGVWLRQGLIIVGELPSDQRRVTLEEVKDKLTTYVDDVTLMKQLNQIAGAPDWLGGGEVGRVYYVLNDEGTETIHFSYGVISYVYQDSNGAEQVELLHKPDQYEPKTYEIILNTPDYGITTDLAEMAKKAELIVEGRYENKLGTTQRTSNLYSDEYIFIVDNVLYGDVNETKISISVPSYELHVRPHDDRYYEVRAAGPYFEKIEYGKSYMLFLRSQAGFDDYIQASLPFQISFDEGDIATLDFLRTDSEEVKIAPNGDKLVFKRDALGIESSDRISGMSRGQIIEKIQAR
ncbi:hypothetical protein D3P09_26845 [Paenibacillus pinisoli]|uniref:Uncharacterized protein n=1 Tax=Paenibacillus pinisoli TaxID=1276110 RepID=A0A3A6PAD8_9BACL|nr:hypothetical protein [Paenibacillus pinisoli]RJX36680.1 hypothetical protein D3P09_26845 [Paenibacillus pinisoli]